MPMACTDTLERGQYKLSRTYWVHSSNSDFKRRLTELEDHLATNLPSLYYSINFLEIPQILQWNRTRTLRKYRRQETRQASKQHSKNELAELIEKCKQSQGSFVHSLQVGPDIRVVLATKSQLEACLPTKDQALTNVHEGLCCWGSG
ncbi:Hypothetical predicted protein [Paramuricea clavata]|uniref:Uncharacterized protein n=1 Tax=Paramuricea clavata TaxID=317549 RepID=A0A6S7H5N3_PARCT|nr:Hypothetical predicted protein [Paramuricea clavata]